MNAPSRRFWFALLCLVLAASLARAEGDVAAVLSSRSGPYSEAYQGFQEALGRPVDLISLPESGNPKIPSSVKVVVAFGAKASSRRYPSNIVLIHCMSPGISERPRSPTIPPLYIHMQPAPAKFALKLKELQPGLRRIAIFWQAESVTEWISEVAGALAPTGTEVVFNRLDSAYDIPDQLRALKGKVDALWLPPDPLLLNRRTFTAIKEFAWANNIPFYAPTSVLVEIGATAAIAGSYREIGKTAANAVRQTLSGLPVLDTYPEKVEVTVSRSAAAQTGLKLTDDILNKADKVLP